jgi:prephenate dehydrogenase
MWLLVYEATLKGWIPNASPCFVAAHPLFGPMLSKKVEFYDSKRNVLTTKKELKQSGVHNYRARWIFSNVDMYF